MNQQLILYQLQAFLLSFVDQMRSDEAIKQMHARHGEVLDWHEERIEQLQTTVLKEIRQTLQMRVHALLESNQTLAMMIRYLIDTYIPLARNETEYEKQSRAALLQAGAEAHVLAVGNHKIDLLWLAVQNVDMIKIGSIPLSDRRVYTKERSGASAMIFPGNGGCYEDFHPLAAWYLQRGINVALFNYRGNVRSTGKASEEGYYCDAEVVYQQLRSLIHTTEEKIIFHGISLGGAIAAKTMEQFPTTTLVLDQTFSSIAEVIAWQAQKLLPVAFGPQFPWVYKELLLYIAAKHLRFETAQSIAKAEGSLFILRSLQDEVIPSSCADRLKKQAIKANHIVRADATGPHGCQWFLTDPQSIASFEEFLINANICNTNT